MILRTISSFEPISAHEESDRGVKPRFLLGVIPLFLFAACSDPISQPMERIDAKASATLTINCMQGCDGWPGFGAGPEKNTFTKSVEVTGSALEDLTSLKLEDRCATTPDLFVRIHTDTDFRQSWTIAKDEDGLPTGMCTHGRTDRHHGKFITFYKNNIMGSK